MVALNVVQPARTAFLLGCHIMEGIVILHRTIHELHTKKLDGVVLKMNFEKSYDKVHWTF